MPLRQGQLAALLAVTSETSLPKISWSLSAGRLHVRIVTSDAVQLAFADAIALAEPHREDVFEQVVARRRLWPEWNHINAERFVERCSGAEIPIVFAFAQDSRVAGLVAAQADVVRKPSAQLCWIDNCVGAGCCDMRFPRTMTVLAAHG